VILVNESALLRFFGVVRRPQTWLSVLFNWLAFPLGLFYFLFLVIGLSIGVSLVVVWVGIPILLVVAGAWWLFGAFERWQVRVLLRADIPGAPREWERVDGVWAKLRAHFGSGATWKDLAYLLVKLPLGIVSTILLMTFAGMVFWLLAMPFFAIAGEPVVNGTWVPPLWFGILCVPVGVLVFVLALMFRGAQPAVPAAPPAYPVGAAAPAPAPPVQPAPVPVPPVAPQAAPDETADDETAG
jgi:hypothetical protein